MPAITVTTSNGLVTIFPTQAVLSNISSRYCSYYTAGSNLSAFSNADAFLSNINFSNVYTNIQAGISNINVLTSSNTPFSNTVAMQTYRNNIDVQLQQLSFVANCVTEQTDMTESLYSNAKELSLSKERYDMIDSPETHVSYYEGTFPIYRPIGQTTMFALFGMALFLMLLSILLFLKTQGIELQLIMPQTFALPGAPSMFSGQLTYIGIASLVGVVLGYFIHVYYKQ